MTMALRSSRLPLALAALLAPAVAAATESHLPEVDDSRRAAAAFVSVEAAQAAGYEQLFECITHGEHGSMGIHYIHPARAGDGRLVVAEPDVLMYEPQADGALQLVALEYIVFENDWQGEGMPQMFGRELARRTAVGPHAVDPFYQVHLWHWRHNPAGLFADYNPYVGCPEAQ